MFSLVSGYGQGSVMRCFLERRTAMISPAFRRSMEDGHRDFVLPGVDKRATSKTAKLMEFLTDGQIREYDDADFLTSSPEELLQLLRASELLEIPEMKTQVMKRCMAIDPATSLPKDLVLPHVHGSLFRAMGRRYSLCTRSILPGLKVHKDKIVHFNGEEYRIWNPRDSNLSAAVCKDVELHWGIGSSVLYLGAAIGRTVSHVADVIGDGGRVYAVEISRRGGERDLDVRPALQLRTNIVPTYADARHPEDYEVDFVDAVISDTDQPDEVVILYKNARRFLRPGGYMYAFVKDIDLTSKISYLSKKDITVKKNVELGPYAPGYVCIVGRFGTDE